MAALLREITGRLSLLMFGLLWLCGLVMLVGGVLTLDLIALIRGLPWAEVYRDTAWGTWLIGLGLRGVAGTGVAWVLITGVWIVLKVRSLDLYWTRRTLQARSVLRDRAEPPTELGILEVIVALEREEDGWRPETLLRFLEALQAQEDGPLEGNRRELIRQMRGDFLDMRDEGNEILALDPGATPDEPTTAWRAGRMYEAQELVAFGHTGDKLTWALLSR